MATTATLKITMPMGPYKMQVWRVAAGASDTTAQFKTGLNNVLEAVSVSQDDSSHGLIPNSSNGTEGNSKGEVYLTGVINSAKIAVIVIGA